MATYVDAESAVKSWIDAQTTALVGVGNPLTKGAHMHPLRGAATVCYALLSVIGGSPALSAEDPDQRARISASIYGPTREAATKAAVAYLNAVISLSGKATPMGDAATCLVVDPDSISGPLWAPDAAGPRLVVDADFYFRPV